MAQQAAFTELPVVDVSGLYSSDPANREKVAEKLGRAAGEVGFFYVTGHPVDRRRREALLSATRSFFALPEEAKMAIHIGRSGNHRGYVPEGEEVMVGGKRDRKEALDLGREVAPDHPDVVAGTPMIGPNQWPELPGFREAVEGYYDDVFDLGRHLLKGFALALGVEETFFDGFVTNPPSQLRLIHYPFDPSAEDVQGIGAHTDYECFTLLLPTAPGLEVMNGDGEWIDVPLLDDAFVVNIGDMMEVWTGGRFVATSHRVRKVKEERYSFPLFFACDYHTEVAPLPEVAGPAPSPRYTPIRAGDHLYAQTIQSFTYLRQRLERGELVLPEGSKALSSFGQSARRKPAANA
ncbi:isopenicillin N synthase family dioxygenase [Jiella sonneratiae]|uniref:Isopenicillin N synthase family oxygenase n=1 Tax=Jiella sonneratiae TaxID=2816856 RepID=A0ABS3J2U3_9HYPH|nr:2-oxoglutarate and iron-dependent oxygenase domain-containing protein [Jiella sonneratiae]MBO0903984.1 isopenicillin N synthase family oxygenase [Jiella sonneratiae]